jgi:AP endonuclease-2
VHGSDHCPVYVDFHDEIEIEGRGKVKLWDEMNPGRDADAPAPAPPAFAARNFKEFSSAQQLLASFFGKAAASSTTSATGARPVISGGTSSTSIAPSDGKPSAPTSRPATPKSPGSSSTVKTEDNLSKKRPVLATRSQSNEANQTRWKGKGKEAPAETTGAAQTSISSFFSKPAPPSVKQEKIQPKSKKKSKKAAETSPAHVPSPQRPSSTGPSANTDVIIIDDDDEAAVSGAPSEEMGSGGAGSSNGAIAKVLAAAQAQNELASLEVDEYEATVASNNDAASAWSNIFAAKAAPTCDGHGEPTKLWTVNKTGINKGRRFYLCQR